MHLRKLLAAAETTVVWLFLLQALRVLFASLFGVFYDALFDQALPLAVVGLDLLLIVLAMLTPLLLRRSVPRPDRLLAAVSLVLFARIPLSFQQPTLRLYMAILLLGSAAFYIAHLLWHEPERLTAGLVAGLGVDQMLRALDYTYDPSLRPAGLPLVVAAALITGGCSLYLARTRRPRVRTIKDRPHLYAGVGLGAALFVQTSFLALPNALTHWTGLSYGALAPALLIATLLPLGPLTRSVEWYLAAVIWPLGGLLTVALVLLCVALAADLGGIAAALLLLIAQFLFLINLRAGVNNKRAVHGEGLGAPGVVVSFGLLLFLLLNLTFAFTFTYPYTLSFFRGWGTLFLLLGIALASLPAVNAMREPELPPVKRRSVAFGLGAILVPVVAVTWLTRGPALLDRPAPGSIRLGTYNVHYGFDTDWTYNLEEMATTIEAAGVDVVVLQEVDAARITSLSVDGGLWLGQRLEMHTVYQPTLERLSGIALLSRYPLQASDGQWLTSALEQTAIVHGALRTDRGPLDVYGVWLGLEPDERAIQLAEALDYIGPANPVALGGDFNATPDSPVYTRLVQAGFQDPFTAIGAEQALTSPASDPTERIDYVWLRGLTPRNAWVSESTASDHRLVVVEAQTD